MPKATTNSEMLTRARAQIAEARSLGPLPDRGHERGRLVVKVRSRLAKAEQMAKRVKLKRSHPTPDEEREADRIIQEVERLWPIVLS